MAQAPRDENQVTTLLLVDDTTGETRPALCDSDGNLLVILSGAGAGTVTDVSVVTANGFAGTVANSTTTPAITLSTTVTGILSGNGTAISAASTTGSGAVVLANTPTLITPILGVATATSINKVAITAPATAATLTIADGVTLTVSNTMTLAGPTGSGSVVFANTPTLITPVLGAATATSINGLTITSSTGTLTITNAKTLAATNSLTLSGTDGTTMTFPTTTATIARTDAAQTFTGIQTFSSAQVLSTGTVTVSGNTITFPAAAGTLATLAGTETFTNKRITQRVQSVADAATITPNASSDDCVDITAIAQAFTIANASGSPTNFQKLIIRIKDNGTARAITFGSDYVAGGVALPTTTVLSKIMTLGFIYNTANSLNKWQLVANAQEA